MTPPIEPPGASEIQAAENRAMGNTTPCPLCGVIAFLGEFIAMIHKPDGEDCLRNQLVTARAENERLRFSAELGERFFSTIEAACDLVPGLERDASRDQLTNAYIDAWQKKSRELKELQAKLTERDAEVERLKGAGETLTAALKRIYASGQVPSLLHLPTGAMMVFNPSPVPAESEALDALPPNDDALDALVERFPAPQEWYEENVFDGKRGP